METHNTHLAALCILALALGLPALHAAQPPPFFSDYAYALQLSLPDGALPPDSVVFVRYANESGRDVNSILVAKENGTAILYSRFQVQRAFFTYDDPVTPSLDAYWDGSLSGSQQPATIRFQPVADIAGVLTSQEGAVLADVPVELTCPEGFRQAVNTSNTGAFSFSRIRTGACIISANVEGQSVRQDISLSRGEFASLQLQLRKPDYLLPFVIGSAVILAGVLLVAWLLQGKKGGGQQPKGRGRPPSPAMPTARQKDLLSTLDSKERAIVEFLMHHYPSAVKVSKVRRDLLIPKTSLTRTLQSLERKQFLKVEKMGFRTFAKLHDFFKTG